jgi:methylmalonyl-CoA/ethylmalonyl-CoA epimerase
MKVRKIDHIAIAVHSIADASKLFIDTLGGEFLEGSDNPPRAMRTIQLSLGGVKLELMEPLSEDSDVQRFLDKHGEGFHHMTIYVEDLDESIASLEGAGFEVVDTAELLAGWRETYVRPRSGFGTLLQIVETEGPPSGLFDDITLDQVLAGDVTRENDWVPIVRGP